MGDECRTRLCTEWALEPSRSPFSYALCTQRQCPGSLTSSLGTAPSAAPGGRSPGFTQMVHSSACSQPGGGRRPDLGAWAGRLLRCLLGHVAGSGHLEPSCPKPDLEPGYLSAVRPVGKGSEDRRASGPAWGWGGGIVLWCRLKQKEHGHVHLLGSRGQGALLPAAGSSKPAR